MQMDPIATKKFQEIKIKKSKKNKNQLVLDNFLLGSLSAITCTLFCFNPFWFSSIKLFATTTILKIASFVSNTKVLFVISNLIVFVLIGESKFFSSRSCRPADAYYEEYVKRRSRKVRVDKSMMKKEKVEIKEVNLGFEKEIETNVDDLGHVENHEKCLIPTEELNKRADDLIARANRQRRLEAKSLLCCRDF